MFLEYRGEKDYLHSKTLLLQNKSKAFLYYKMFFDFSFFLLISPFRIVQRSSYYQLYSNRLQKAGSLLVMTLASAISVLILREVSNTAGKISDRPEALFEIATFMTNSGYCFVLVYIFWFKKSSLANILKICQNDRITFFKRNARNTVFPGVLCVAGIALPLYFIVRRLILFPNTFRGYIKSYYSRYLYNLHITDNKTESLDEEDPNIGIGVAIFGSITMFLEIYWQIVIQYAVLLCLISSLTMYAISQEFQSYMQIHTINNGIPKLNSSNVFQISNYYERISRLVTNINDINGPLLTVFITEAVPYFALNIITIFDTDSYLQRIILGYTMTYYFAILLIAAEANNKLHCFNAWILSASRTIPDTDITLKLKVLFLVLDASNTPMGLKGGEFFLVTYQFVGAMTSVFVTYAIITIQFKGIKP